jgi:tRNA acetyltransferase TAN1
VPSSLEEIVNAVVDLKPKISDDETFRVTVRRRQSDLATSDVVHGAAEVISRKVNLERPDKTVWVEIIGQLSGISILVPEYDILSVRTMENETV